MRPRAHNIPVQAGEGGFSFQLSVKAVRVKGTTDTAAIQALCGTRIKSDPIVAYLFHPLRRSFLNMVGSFSLTPALKTSSVCGCTPNTPRA